MITHIQCYHSLYNGRNVHPDADLKPAFLGFVKIFEISVQRVLDLVCMISNWLTRS